MYLIVTNLPLRSALVENVITAESIQCHQVSILTIFLNIINLLRIKKKYNFSQLNK